VTKQRAERAGIRISAETIEFSLPQNVQTDSGTQTASYFMGTVVLSPGIDQQGREAELLTLSCAVANNEQI